MKVPEILSLSFGAEFENLIGEFAVKQGLLPDLNSLRSPRFVARSIVPHVLKLSSLFNRVEKDQGSGLAPYWKESSNPIHLRMAYFLYFMPSNLYRMAAIWAELSRLGFRWSCDGFRAVEFGAGPATGLAGIAAGERYAGVGLPTSGNWALIEQDKAVLDLGVQWAEAYLNYLDFKDWGIRKFHRKIESQEGFLPRSAPKFHLWIMSYYLNELTTSPKDLAATLVRDWTRHLEEEGIVILMEPALKLQSRKLLELRKEILLEKERTGSDWLQILLPCLGHQACGALANPEDWCHDDVSWWRPPYFRQIDKLAELDRKTLPFSYLVITKSRRKREEILPALAGFDSSRRHRLVSPAHAEGHEQEFFLCGEDGKKRARYRPKNDEDPAANLQRGDILLGSESRGDRNSARISKIADVK